MMNDNLPKCKYAREVFNPDPLNPVDSMCAFEFETEGSEQLVPCIGVLNCAQYSYFYAFDPVSHPSHYTEGREYEPKDVIYDWGLDFNLGCAVKYISRAGRKDDIIQDLEKAKQYIQFEIDAIQKKRSKEELKND